MRKLIVSLIVLAVMVLPVAALTQAEWDVIEAEDAAKAAKFEDFKVAKAKVAEAEMEGDHERVAELLEAIAAKEDGHCAREGNEWVRAWQYNNAAYALIKANEKKGYKTDVKVLEKILELCGKARSGANSACLVKIDRNESWANERLK